MTYPVIYLGCLLFRKFLAYVHENTLSAHNVTAFDDC